MKVTNATLVLEEFHEEVHSISENDHIIGYLAKTKNEELPFGAVSSDGADLGEFDCPDCAIKAIYSKAHNITHGRMITGSDPRKMLLAALMMSLLSPSEKRDAH